MSAFSDKIVSLNPHSYWRLGDSSAAAGAVAARAHGAGTLTYQGTMAAAQAAYFSADTKAVLLDSDDDYGAITGVPDSVLHGTHAVAFWFQETVRLGGDNPLLGAGGTATNQGLHLVIRGGNLHQGFYANDNPGPAISTGVWYFVVFQYDGATQKIYLDDKLVASRATTTGYTGVSSDLALGRSYGTDYTPNTPRVRIAELALFDRALTDAEVAELRRTVPYIAHTTVGATTFVVPAGVSSLNVDLAGAQGGAGGGSGGLGGRVQATIPSTPGETLNLYVGGMGVAGGQNQTEARKTGGYNGGGTGGWSNDTENTNERHGGSGGGASDIRRGGTALSNRVLVAGGGGGAGFSNTSGGVGGGLTGGRGGTAPNTNTPGGYGATQTAGGNNGANQTTAATTTQSASGASGALGVGGDGSYVTWQASGNNNGASGGGGGGYYGGGGGSVSGSFAESGGGGGGSSYTASTATNVVHTQGHRTGSGYITLTYTPILSPYVPAIIL